MILKLLLYQFIIPILQWEYTNHSHLPGEGTRRFAAVKPCREVHAVCASETFSQTSRFEDKVPQRRCSSCSAVGNPIGFWGLFSWVGNPLSGIEWFQFWISWGLLSSWGLLVGKSHSMGWSSWEIIIISMWWYFSFLNRKIMNISLYHIPRWGLSYSLSYQDIPWKRAR